MMKIVLLEAFNTGSHQKWALGLQEHSKQHIEIISLPGRFWKWRMHGGAISLAEKVNKLDYTPDLFLTTDMMDSALFKSLLKPELRSTPIAVYFHENQITYPWSPTDRDVIHDRDRHYGFINYTSALVADRVFFNSKYHQESFLNALPKFLKAFPDHRNMGTVDLIRQKSQTLYLGLELSVFNSIPPDRVVDNTPVILWNHRWEYDKNPQDFFHVLNKLKKEEIPFTVIVLGENTSHKPTIFDEAKQKLSDRILHWGYVDSFEQYIGLLKSADYLPVTSYQDFFGISVMEAICANVIPILPNRLVYPEHFPIEQFSDLYYEDHHELFVKLKTKLLEHGTKHHRAQMKPLVQIHDWENCINSYDQELERVESAEG